MNALVSNYMNSPSMWMGNIGFSKTPNYQTVQKIRSFGFMPHGWHYGSGAPASTEVIRIALAYLHYLIGFGFTETDAFFGADGQIMVTAYYRKHRVEVTVELDRLFTVAHQFDGEDKFYEPDMPGHQASLEIASIVASIEPQECGTFGSSILETMTAGQANLRTLLSPHLAVGVVHQFLTNNVVSPPAARSADTLPDFTPELAENRQFSGYLMNQRSIPVVA